jgi:ring-1,2-phenylacetyl-CoA epoxidase subunit PaaC
MDCLEVARLDLLKQFSYPPIAEAATRIRKEESYHQRHTHAWVLRLSQGTEESHARMQAAINQLWPYTPQLINVLPNENVLVEAGYIPDGDTIRQSWEGLVIPLLQESGLELPVLETAEVPSRSEHTQYLDVLLDEMQSVPRMDPGASW